jgi:AraC-like DNA-binding protein
MDEWIGLLAQQAVTTCICIPACTEPVAKEAWRPGHLSFQLVLRGQIPTTPWHHKSETVLRAGGLICCAPNAASTRRYDVDRQHLAFSAIGDQLHVHLYQRQSDYPIGHSDQQKWQTPLPSGFKMLCLLIERGFAEGLDEQSLQHLAKSAPGVLLQTLNQQKNPQLQRAMNWLREHAAKDLSRDDLADFLGCHPDHVTRLFRNAGMASFADERKRIRCEMALTLLADPAKSLAEIAGACGFNSETYFIRSFKHMYALTPGAWRQRQDFAS